MGSGERIPLLGLQAAAFWPNHPTAETEEELPAVSSSKKHKPQQEGFVLVTSSRAPTPRLVPVPSHGCEGFNRLVQSSYI